VKVAIVANGPTAKGKGDLIDACDYVVRMKAFWEYGATDSGSKLDALCWFGKTEGWQNAPDLSGVEMWITQEPRIMLATPERVRRVVNTSNLGVIRWQTYDMFYWAGEFIGVSPTTGFSAINMAIHILHPVELHLFGFDHVGFDKPNAHDARRSLDNEVATDHDMTSEKHRIADLFRGVWMGEKCETKLIWHEMPDMEG